jgi:hypothetical protein
MSFVILESTSFGFFSFFFTQAAFAEWHHYTLTLPEMPGHVCWDPFIHIPLFPEGHHEGGEKECQ